MREVLLVLGVAFLALLKPAPAAALASCFSAVLGRDGLFAEQIERDPPGAIAALNAQLAGTERPAGAPSRAQLYAMLMDAYANAGNIDAARAAAADGTAALTAADDEGLRRRLRFTSIKLQMDQGHLREAASQYERAAAEVPEDARDLVCVLGDRGYLRFLTGQKVAGAADAMRAYELAAQVGMPEIRLLAGQLLARLYSEVGLYDEALALADAPIVFYAHSANAGALSDAYLFRGDVYVYNHEYPAANADFLESRELLQKVGDQFALSYTQQRLCSVAAAMPSRPDAESLCRSAYQAALAVKNRITAKIALASLGKVELAGGHARAAVELWDQVLADDGVDIPRHLRSDVYHYRAQALAQLGDAAGGLRDTNLYLAALEEEQKTRSADQVALLNVKFQTTLKQEELATAQAEAHAARLATLWEESVRNLTAVVALILVAAAFLAGWLWQRKRAREARLANEERLASIGRLTGGIAHDFNNLVTVLQQSLGLLEGLGSVTRDPAALDLVQQAKRASEICAQITSQLLSFSRQQNLQPESIELDAYLHEVLPLLERTAGGGVKIRLEVGRPGPVARADRRQLTAALLNLVSNARDAMGRGGTVTLSAARADQRVRLDVVDEGCGMVPAVLARAVEPFFSTKGFGSGSGLGLSTVQGFVSQSGGELQIRSEPNRGTTVTLWLPAATATP